jgi:hypothetical protein
LIYLIAFSGGVFCGEEEMQQTNRTNILFHGVDLQALSAFHSEHGQVFSLYMDLRSREDLPARFDRLLANVEDQQHISQDTPENQQKWRAEADRIREWIVTGAFHQAQGLALISSLADGIWHPFYLSVPIADRLFVKDQAYIQPLELLVSEYRCTIVALLNDDKLRLLRVFLGQGEELGVLQETDPARMAQSAGARIEAAMQEQGCDHLIVGGSGEAIQSLPQALPEDLQPHISIEPNLSARADIQDIAARVRELDADRERLIEAQRVAELLASGENDITSVLGIEQVMLAVRGGKARVLVVDEDFHAPGGECPNCGFLGEGSQGVCLLCGMSLRPEPDIVAVAMKRVLEKGGEIDVLRSTESYKALEEHGYIGALLYAQEDPGHVEETANQSKIASGGQVHPDALHDEHVEESFPASDPPGNW